MIGAWTRRVVLAGCLLPLAAQAAVPSPAGQRCIVKAARAFGLVAQAQRRDVARCLRDSAHGRLPAGQTPAACIAADGTDRVRRARIRAIRTEAVACRAAPSFGWAPGAATDEDGITGRGFARAIFGAALDARASADARRCRAAVLAQADRCAGDFVLAYVRCAARALPAAADATALVRCKGVGGGAACDAGLARAIAERCAGLDVGAVFPGCAGTPADRCIAGHARAAVSRGLNATGALCPSGPPPPAPEPIALDVVPLPAGVRAAETPWFTADGSRLLFAVIQNDVPGQQIATIAADGSDFRCLTCPFATPGAPVLWKPIAFRDGRRVMVRVGEQTPVSAADHAILECTPSVLDCTQAVLVPVEPPSADDPNVQQDEREMRPAPDGLHVGLTQQRDGTPVSIVGRLERLAERYVVRDARVVSTLGELKQFTPDQRGVVVAAYAQNPFEAANPDAVRVDLADGSLARATTHPDYDEPLEYSPDGAWFTVGSGRGGRFLSVFSQVPRPGIVNLGMETVVAYFFATRRVPLLEPWLVDRWGARGDYVGQQLNPDSAAAGWDGRMIMNWSPDGTKITFWEARIASGPDPQSRLVVARLASRVPVTPLAPQPLPAMDWAPPLAGYVPPAHEPASRAGAFSGTATVTWVPGPLNALTVTYADFSDDGRDFIDGTEHVDFVPGTLRGRMTWDADVALRGCRQGRLRATQASTTVVTFAGRVESEVDGRFLVLE